MRKEKRIKIEYDFMAKTRILFCFPKLIFKSFDQVEIGVCFKTISEVGLIQILST